MNLTTQTLWMTCLSGVLSSSMSGLNKITQCVCVRPHGAHSRGFTPTLLLSVSMSMGLVTALHRLRKMERWSFVFVCSVYLNVLVNLFSIRSQSVRISTNATQPFVTDGTTQMALFCQTDGVSPPVSYTWAGVECINEHHQRGTCIFTPRVPQDDGLQVTCDAYNEISLELWTSEPYTIQLSYPPPSPPNITGYKEGSVLTEGEQITLKCTVHGGKPKVTSVTFYCGDGRDSTDVFGDEFVTSSVVITVQTKHNNTVCKCSATWTQHQMYRDTTFIRLFVRGFISTTPDRVYSSSSPQDEVGQSVPTGVIAGVAVAIVAIIVAIAIAIVVYVTRRQQNHFQEHVNEFYISTGFEHNPSSR
ncbi:uncharacterized protein LOC112568135 isoform X3 [Pomacea canaliculata]|uniref:uncharacterized protein LOC112568135 isoform X3 n=1 Tax=Pomacea canaliculata TaxID=400727 RepID=UPI000D725C50|nr:uncharacterized protein LOC112568135 isoform X3 [Pomacea canaliculata]